jgi:predicted transcriptional regulator
MSVVKSIRINEDLRCRLEAFASRHQRTSNFVINEALQLYLEMKEREDVLIEAAEESWAEYQTNHQAADGDEVLNWILSWGSPSESPAPKCRKL